MNESLITEALKSEERTIDELSEITHLAIAKLSSLLTSLEIKGIIKRMPGGIYTLA